MKNLQKWGGLAALYEAAAYIFGMVFFLAIVDYGSVVDPAEKMALLVTNQIGLYVMTLLIYVVFAVFLVILALALHQQLKAAAPEMMQIATVFGLIWAGLLIASGMIFNIGMATAVDLYGSDPEQAATVWLAIDTVSEGIGGGNEIVGGLWLLLVSWVALRGNVFPRVLNIMGIVIGVAGIISTIPALGEIGGMIFGLGQIVWFIWLGIVMLRGNSAAA